jgi:dolichyl-phosphate beta-glucosyltransferase
MPHKVVGNGRSIPESERARMDLSIVIPTFNEITKITADIEAAVEFLCENNMTGEIIVVDDGSEDSTADAAEQSGRHPAKGVSLKVIRSQKHRGKGFAVRSGIEQTSGEFVVFADSGSCVPYKNTLRGLEVIETGICDIAHGSRKLPGSKIVVAQPWRRRISARLFRWLAKKWMRIPAVLTDTQCGFKLYRGDVARRLYSQCISDGFMFDVEIILRAQRQGYRIKEFPIEWTCDPDSRLSLVSTSWFVFREFAAIKQDIEQENL